MDAERWRREGKAWAEDARAWLGRAQVDGFERAGPAPVDTRGDLAVAVLAELRAADEARREELRADLPRAYLPLLEILEERGTHASAALHLDDGRIAAAVHRADAVHDDPERQAAWVREIAERARAGHAAVDAAGSSILLDNARAALLSLPAPWRIRPVVAVLGGERASYLEGVHTIGRSMDRRVFALVRDEGIELRRGWDAPGELLPWPDPGWVTRWMNAAPGPGWVDEVLPFNDGERVLIVGRQGVHELDRAGMARLYPSERRPMVMAHAALSPDEALLAVGDQDEPHRVLDREGREVASLAPWSAFAHRACWGAEGRTLALNSCHEYAGVTFSVATSALPGLRAEAHDPRLSPLDGSARAYRMVARGDEFLIGDAHGWLRFARPGDPRPRLLYVGGNPTGLDVSADGREAVVATAFGTVHRIALDGGDDPFAVGDAPHREVRRWMFLAGEAEPLTW